MRCIIGLLCVLGASALRRSATRAIIMQNFNLGDFLTGKSMVQSAKKLEPELFKSSSFRPNSQTSKPAKVSEEGKLAIALFKKEYSKAKVGGSYDLTEDTLGTRFNALASLVKDDKIALQIVKNVPDVLIISSERCSGNFAVFEGKFGFDGAVGLITRNPNILSVPTVGYGSAEIAGPETIALSYVINFTRPVGKVLIFLLLSALLKPLLAPYLGF
jgi:hypothetical protein